jgi:hypothetical protein
MGGIGAFGMALRGSGRFAALISVCGACPLPERLEELADLPQWVAWAEDDEIAYLTEGSRRIADSLARHGRLVARPYRLEHLRIQWNRERGFPSFKMCDSMSGDQQYAVSGRCGGADGGTRRTCGIGCWRRSMAGWRCAERRRCSG